MSTEKMDNYSFVSKYFDIYLITSLYNSRLLYTFCSTTNLVFPQSVLITNY